MRRKWEHYAAAARPLVDDPLHRDLERAFWAGARACWDLLNATLAQGDDDVDVADVVVCADLDDELVEWELDLLPVKAGGR